jgi:predicted TPR repeat methyltransferase
LVVSTRHACLACGSEQLDLLIDFGQMPLAGGFLRPEDVEMQAAYPLRLARCNDCTLMQVLDTVEPEVIFDRYSYSSSTTNTLVGHFASVGEELVRLGKAVGKLIVEFGCNDGVLVRPLLKAGAKVVGVDPSDVAESASQEQGWPLFKEYFGKSVAERIRSEYGPARIVTGNNVFAHTDDLHGILEGVTTLLDDKGLFVFEVHYQGDLLALVQFDTVYHEHICYHSLTSLKHLLASHGLTIVAVERIPIHAGSIHVTATRKGLGREVSTQVRRMIKEESAWDIECFVGQVRLRRAEISGLVKDLRSAGRRVAAYGAAGRATILLNYCHLDSGCIDYISDMSPLRFGKLVPGVNIPIVSPEVFSESPPDYALMTAWNYEREIVSKEKKFLAGGGRFIVPLPETRVIGD